MAARPLRYRLMRIRMRPVTGVILGPEDDFEIKPLSSEYRDEPESTDRLIDLKEAAKLLGIANGTLRNWVSAGHFTADHGLIRIGRGRGRLRVSRQKLLRAIEAGTVHAET
jgi:hypothetical protein